MFDPIRRVVYGPKVRVDFGGTDDTAYFAVTPDQSRRLSSWIRVRVRNTWGSAAQNCRGYLARVEKWDETARAFAQAEYWDTQLLAWASRGDRRFEPVDLPRGIQQFLDVVAHSSAAPHPKFELQTQYKPYREVALGNEKGLFRLTIVVTGDNFGPKVLRLRYRWSGNWRSPQVEPT